MNEPRLFEEVTKEEFLLAARDFANPVNPDIHEALDFLKSGKGKYARVPITPANWRRRQHNIHIYAERKSMTVQTASSKDRSWIYIALVSKRRKKQKGPGRPRLDGKKRQP